MPPTTTHAAVPAFSLTGGYHRLRDSLREGRRRRGARRWEVDDQQRLEFYRQFISPGDLVFDIGANRGNRTKVFLRLDARVVAVEPQVECAAFLDAVFGASDRLTIERTALGAEPGEATMILSDESTIATLSRDWVESVSQSGRFDRSMWRGEEKVRVTTLDTLVARHGQPAFAKIDVEGFESQVLAGLSTPVGALSLEFVPERLDQTRECIDRLESIGRWRYQFAHGEAMAFDLPQWTDRVGLIARLRDAPRAEFGDIYARNEG